MEKMASDIYLKELLYGHDPTEGIVSIEVSGNLVFEYIQCKDGSVKCNIVRGYEPWLYQRTNEPNTDDVNHFNTITRVKNFKEYRYLRLKRHEAVKLQNLESLYLIDTGKTLFKGLKFEDVHSVGWDIETTGLNPEKHKVKMISIADNRGFKKVIHSDDERQLILDFIKEIKRLDSSIIMGYNSSFFDIPFMLHRCSVHGITLALGRDGSEPLATEIRVRLGVGMDDKQTHYRIFGRQCLDLYFDVIKYDFTDRKLMGSGAYKLKNVISQYGLEREGRIILTPDEIFDGLNSPPESQKFKDVMAYCEDDSVDLINLNRHIGQANYYLTQIIPFNYDVLCYLGNVGRINALMVRAYLRSFTSIPLWKSYVEAEDLLEGSLMKSTVNTDRLIEDKVYEVLNKDNNGFTVKSLDTQEEVWYNYDKLKLFVLKIKGAQVQADETGIFHNIGDSDISSMYPSLMILYNIFPKYDHLGIMKHLLMALRTMRYEVKAKATALEKSGKEKSVEYTFIKGQDLAYKVSINCFHPETKVLTINGYKLIADINIGDLVGSINPDTLEFEWKPMIAKERKQKGERMLSLTTNHNKVVCVTENHNLATFDKDLRNHGYNIVQTKLIKKYAKAISIGDAIPIPLKPYDTKLNKKYFSLLSSLNDDTKIVFKAKNKIDLRIIRKEIRKYFDKTLTWHQRNSTLYILVNTLTDNEKLIVSELEYNIRNNLINCNFNIYLKRYKSKSSPVTINMDAFMTLMGWFIAEGSTSISTFKKYPNGNVRGITKKITISQFESCNPVYVAEIKTLLESIGLDYYYNSKNFEFINSYLYDLIVYQWKIGTSRHKFIPIVLLNLSNELLTYLLTAFFKGDGNLLKTKLRRYSTSSIQLKDDICYILQRFGTPFSVACNKDIYRILELKKHIKHNGTTVEYIKSIKEIDRPEYVWDVTVADNHTICVGENGSICTFQSMFGYLGSKGAYWKDDYRCASVTSHGRELIIKIRNFLINKGYQITALDTDGVAYTNGNPLNIETINQDIQNILPKGIEIESKTYKAMIVFARKTYCVETEHGEFKFKGVSLTGSNIAPMIKRFIHKIAPLLVNNDFEGVRILYESLRKQIISQELPIDEYTQTQKVNLDITTYLKNRADYLKEKGKNKGSSPIHELAIKQGIELEVGNKVAYYHAIRQVEKPITEAKKRKRELRAMTIEMFKVEEVPVMIEKDSIEWVSNYNPSSPDINAKYYLTKLEDKVDKLLYKKVNKKTGTKAGVLSQQQYEYIVGSSFDGLDEYIYKDCTERFANGGFAEWNRVLINKIWQIMANNGTDQFLTVQRFKNPVAHDYEPVFQPLYFDLDSKNLKYSFEDAKNIYRFFKYMLKVPDEHITVWFSGSKGFHIEVRSELFGLKPRYNLQLINKELALDLIKQYQLTTIDIGSIYSKRRMWRVPLSIHSKTNIRKTRIPEIDKFESVYELLDYVNSHQNLQIELQAYRTHLESTHNPVSSNELKLWIQTYIDTYQEKLSLQLIRKPKYKFNQLKGYPRCVDYLLKNSIAVQGDRNRATMVLGAFFKESGVLIDDAIEIISNWTENIPSHLTSTSECGIIRTNVKSVLQKVYESETYSFQCYYIKPLISSRGFQCPATCKLSD